MTKILTAYGLTPRQFIPHRSSEGYGLSEAALTRCINTSGKPDLLISVDCGTTSGREIAWLGEQGIDVIVVDHHEPGTAGRPPAVALVNPKCTGGPTYLCGAGVCFKLAHALLKERRIQDFDLKSLLELVALATITDIVPLVEENRIMTRWGLRRLARTENIGLKMLQQAVGLQDRVSSMDVGFRIGPRLNAAGRLDLPEDALALLLSSDATEAGKILGRLEQYNRQRQNLENRIQEEALSMLDDATLQHQPVIVLGSPTWHPGVVGIVASRLMRRFHKPSFVIAIDEAGVGKGSGRGIPGVSLVGAIENGRAHLIAGGGHEMAAGISIRQEQIDAFRESFSEYVLSQTSAAERQRKLHIDAEIPLAELSLEFLQRYELLQPFGSGNPQPVFMARQVRLTAPPRHLKNHHLKLSLRQHDDCCDAIFFGGGTRKLPEPPWDVAFTISRNYFRGRTSLQMIVQEIRASVDT